MRHGALSDDVRERVVLYVFGMLDRVEAEDFERHLGEGCSVCAAEVKAAREAQAALALTAATPPPQNLRRTLLEQIEPLPSGVSATRANEGKWRNTPYPGIHVKPVYRNPVTGDITQLLRFEPGAKLPPHHHTADEQCLVVEGDVRMGNIVFRAGDFTWSRKDSRHHVLTSEQGCLLLIVGSPDDEYEVLGAV